MGDARDMESEGPHSGSCQTTDLDFGIARSTLGLLGLCEGRILLGGENALLVDDPGN